MPFVTILSIKGEASVKAVLAAPASPASIAASTRLMYVRTIERWLALCARLFSACLARLRACGLLAKNASSGVYFWGGKYAVGVVGCQLNIQAISEKLNRKLE